MFRAIQLSIVSQQALQTKTPSEYSGEETLISATLAWQFLLCAPKQSCAEIKYEVNERSSFSQLAECCFTSTETEGLLGTGSQDVHLEFHTAPGLWIPQLFPWELINAHNHCCSFDNASCCVLCIPVHLDPSACLTLSLPWCHLKTTPQKTRKIWNP